MPRRWSTCGPWQRPLYPFSCASPASVRSAHRELLDRFIAASGTGDVDSLLELLSDDVTLWSDGGGRVLAARNPIVGARNVARFLVGVRALQPAGQTYEIHDVNEGRIHGIHVVLNPDKLSAIPPRD